MNENFYYGAFSPIAENDASIYRAGSIFWITDGTVANRHPYVIANTFSHEKNMVICCWVIDSKPYNSDMIPFTMNDGISYINPFKLVSFRPRDIKREYYHSMIDDETFDIALRMYSLMFIKSHKKFKKKLPDIAEKYKKYLEEFFSKHDKLATDSILLNENSLILNTSITDFNLLEFLGINSNEENPEEYFEISESEVRKYYEEISSSENITEEIMSGSISDEDKILFIGLKKIYKIKEICEATHISTGTYYKRIKSFKEDISINDVFVKMENGGIK